MSWWGGKVGKVVWVWVLCVALTYLAIISVDTSLPLFHTVEQIVESHGYQLDSHRVTTSDGVLLVHHRIVKPEARRGEARARPAGPPVVLQHGLFSTSESWVLNGPRKDLAFILKDAGFDVWLTNIRGNDFAQVLETYPKNREYHDFSFQEPGLIDLPATLDYILATTGYKNVSVVAHSMGNSMVAALLATQPYYNAKINFYVAIAPVLKRAPWTDSGGDFYSNRLPRLLKKTNYLEFLDKSPLCTKYYLRPYLSYYMVGLDNWLGDWLRHHIRRLFFESIAGPSMRPSSIPLGMIMTRIPSGKVKFIALHYNDTIAHDDFVMRDYGVEQNLVRYNCSKPPTFDLTRLTVPTSIYYATQDKLADRNTVQWAASRIQNLRKIVRLADFNHFDLVWADDAAEAYFYDILETLEQANNMSASLLTLSRQQAP